MRFNRVKAGVGGILVVSTMTLGAAVAEAKPVAEAVAARPAADPLSFQLPATTDLGLPTTVTATLERFAVQSGQLVAVLDVDGQTVNAVVTDLASNASCSILDLTLGPIHLDLLGLVVDLDVVNLDITAEPGPGNLLGNLLCAVVGLFDGGLFSQVAQLLNRVLSLLNISI
jgi:hypothetical protein